MAIPYVKFERGTIAAYNSLKTNNKLSNDTLYFVYETSASETGKLYLGKKLISGGVSNTSEVLLNLETILTNAGSSKFLVTNSDGEWITASASDVADLLNLQGGEVSFDENLFTSVSGELHLLGFSTASEGALLTKVNGKASWVVPSTELSTRVGTLETDVSNIKNITDNLNTTISTAIAGANHLTYKKVSTLTDIDTTNTIYLVPKSETEDSNGYDEYMLIDNAVEKIGSFGVDLNGYITTSAFETAVGSLATKTELNTVDAKFGDYVTTTVFNNTVGDLSDFTDYDSSSMSTLIDEINYINEKLIWQELTA